MLTSTRKVGPDIRGRVRGGERLVGGGAWLSPGGGRFATEVLADLAKPAAAVLALAGCADRHGLRTGYATQLAIGRQPRSRPARRLAAPILIAITALTPGLGYPAAANAVASKNHAGDPGPWTNYGLGSLDLRPHQAGHDRRRFYDVLSAKLTDGDHGLLVQGTGGCALGEKVFLTVTIRQGQRVAGGAWRKHSCTGTLVPFKLTVSATSGTFHKGTASSVCVSIWKRDGRTVTTGRVRRKVTIT